ncbi:MAG TPA: hypothetical protein DC049_19530 [Spirochaetia bacterium]|nr:hypothetical protein [Spirochaetia bacterium]
MICKDTFDILYDIIHPTPAFFKLEIFFFKSGVKLGRFVALTKYQDNIFTAIDKQLSKECSE